MEVRNCPDCGHIFAFIATNLCPECIAKEEGYCNIVKDYLQAHRASTISEIHEATGVIPKIIIRMLRNGKLQTICQEYDIRLLNCEHCGDPIADGRLCRKCRESFSDAFDKLSETGNAQDSQETETNYASATHFTGHFGKSS